MAPPGVPADSSYWPLAAKSALACQVRVPIDGRASLAGRGAALVPSGAGEQLAEVR